MTAQLWRLLPPLSRGAGVSRTASSVDGAFTPTVIACQLFPVVRHWVAQNGWTPPFVHTQRHHEVSGRIRLLNDLELTRRVRAPPRRASNCSCQYSPRHDEHRSPLDGDAAPLLRGHRIDACPWFRVGSHGVWAAPAFGALVLCVLAHQAIPARLPHSRAAEAAG